MQVMHIVSTFVMNFKQSVVPQIVISYGKKDFNRMNMLVNTGTKITFLLMLMITIPIIFEGEYILNLWLKEPPQYSYELVCLVLININVSSFTYFMYQGVHATGKITQQQIAMSTLYILNIVGIYIVFKLGYSFYYGIFVTIAISLLQCITNLYFAKKTFGYEIKKFINSVLTRCIITTVIAVIVIYGLTSCLESSLMRIIIVTIIGCTTIILSGYFILLDKQERNKFGAYAKSLVRRKK